VQLEIKYKIEGKPIPKQAENNAGDFGESPDRLPQFMLCEDTGNIANDFVVKAQSDFIIGSKKGGLLDKSWVRLGLLGFILAFLALVGIQLNTYLSNYEKRKLNKE